jgi:hypothetical protein
MNTSIPTSVPPDPTGPFAAAPDAACATLLGALNGAQPAGAALNPLFADLLAAAPGSSASGQSDAAATPANAAPASALPPNPSANPVTVTLTTPGVVLSRLVGPGLRPGLLTAATRSPVLAVTSPASDAASAPDLTDTPAPAVAAPTREQLEQALSLLAPLWNLLGQAATALQTAAPDATASIAPAELTVSLQVDGQSPRTATLALPLAAGPGQLPGLVRDLAGKFLAPIAAAATPGLETDADDTDTTGVSAPTPAPEAIPSAPAAVPSGSAVPASVTAPVPTGSTPLTPTETAVNPLPNATSQPVPPVAVDASPVAPIETAAVPGAQSAPRPVSGLEIRLPGGATLTVTVQVPTPADAGQSGAEQQQGRQEKNAEANPAATLAGAVAGNAPEKQFLSAQDEGVKPASSSAGIRVAQKATDMPQLANNPRRFTSSSMPEPVPVRSALVEFLPAAATAPTATVATPEQTAAARESVAHRAVETVLALVDSQRNQPGQGGLVNLNFKFGQDDLSVRVQLRGGEIRTQFRTDSPELRAVLASEWRSASPAAGSGALRLTEPEFVPASASTSSGFGGFAQGQPGSQQNAQQQAQTPAALLFPELRGLRRGAPAEAEVLPAAVSAAYSPQSVHLTAVA